MYTSSKLSNNEKKGIHCIHSLRVPDYENLRQNLYGSDRILWFIRIKKFCCYFLFPPINSSYGLLSQKRYKILSKTLQCNEILDLNRRQRQNIQLCSRLMWVTYMINKASTKCTVQKESSTITFEIFKWNFCTEFRHGERKKERKKEKGGGKQILKRVTNSAVYDRRTVSKPGAWVDEFILQCIFHFKF